MINTPATKTDNILEQECDGYVGLSLVNPQDKVDGVATFANEAALCDTLPYGEPTTSFVSAVPGYQDLKEYFQRPRLIAGGDIPTTRTRFYFAGPDTSTIFGSWFPDGFRRLAGVHGVRFNLKFVLTVAATPFQQSLVAMSFQYDAFPDDLETFPRSESSALVTQLPHVRLDLAEHSMVELDVPFVFRQDYFELNRNDSTLGCIALNTLLPYRSLASAADPTWKLYVSMHDLELIGSMPLNFTTVVPQSGLSRTSERINIGSNQITSEAKSTGSISRLLGGVASGVGLISSAVRPIAPTLSAIGGATDWFLRSASKVASAFGYSKPVIEAPSSKIWRHDYVGEGQIDLPNPAYVVGPFQSNKVRVDSTMGGTDVDEMDMNYVLSKYAQIFVGDFATNDSTGARLYATGVGPYNFWFRTNVGRPGGNLPLPTSSTLTTNAIAPTPLLFFANMFRYWRGGVKFRFTFAKTKFHAGRVIVSYVPQTVDVNDMTPSSINIPALEVAGGLPQPFNYSKVFDLRDSSVFEFECPWMSPTLYLNVGGTVGGLTMTVLDPLIANGEANPIVEYMVEVAGMDDFELSSPSNPSLTPANRANIAFYQSGIAGVGSSPPNVSEYTSGEKFTSVKQLMMMPNYIGGDVPDSTVSVTTLPPFIYRPRWNQAIPMPDTSREYWGFTRSGSVSSCYAFANGSTAWHVYSDARGDSTTMQIVNAANDGNGGASDFSDPRFKTSVLTGTVRVRTQEGVMHAITPMYSKIARVPFGSLSFFYSTRNFGAVGTQVLNRSPLTNVVYNLEFRNNTGKTVRLYLGRAAGDDARCTNWIGVPPVIIFPSTLSAPPDAGDTP
jgi:hypothetical protein